MFAWLVEHGYGSSWREIARRYSREQIELLYYLSRKGHFARIEQEIDWQSKAIAGRLGEVMAKAFS